MLAFLATQWQGGITCTCHCEARIANLQLPVERKSLRITQIYCEDGNSSAVISGSAPTQRVRANAADQRHPSLSQDPPDTPHTSDCVGGVHWHPWRPAGHHQNIRQFFLSLSLCNCSHPLSSWEQRAPWGKIQQSTSNGGDGWRDGNATATAMDGATAMRRQHDGDNNVTATTGGGSAAAARQRRWWLRNRTTAVTTEAWRWHLTNTKIGSKLF